jgi:CheY-like chemotaxis protein
VSPHCEVIHISIAIAGLQRLALTARDVAVNEWPTPAGGHVVSLLILVVDDEPDVAELFRQQFRRDLRSGRFIMEFAESALIALERISEARDVSLILILSDINMPGMTGLELLPKAKALRPDVPVIMISAYGDAETKRKALEGGADALISKPVDFASLRSEIETRVGRAV